MSNKINKNNNMTLQEAKDQVVIESGYLNWGDFFGTNFRTPRLIENLLEVAAELYAEAKAKEAFEAAREYEAFDESNDRQIQHPFLKYPDYETFKQSK